MYSSRDKRRSVFIGHSDFYRNFIDRRTAANAKFEVKVNSLI